MTGTVKWFSPTKGYGFITGDDGNEVFVHYTGIVKDGFKTIRKGKKVSYDLAPDDKGKDQAANVTEIA